MENKGMKNLNPTELEDSQLDQVSGGYYGDEYAPDCSNCGTKMTFLVCQTKYYYYCGNCGHRIEVEP